MVGCQPDEHGSHEPGKVRWRRSDLFLISILVPVYRYNVRLATFYLARADSLILSRDVRVDDFGQLSNLLTPVISFDKEPKTPIETVSSLVKDGRASPGRLKAVNHFDPIPVLSCSSRPFRRRAQPQCRGGDQPRRPVRAALWANGAADFVHDPGAALHEDLWPDARATGDGLGRAARMGRQEPARHLQGTVHLAHSSPSPTIGAGGAGSDAK